MHGANGVASQALHVALQLYVPYQMEFLGCTQGTGTLSTLHTVERDASQFHRTGLPKYHEPW